MLSVTSRMYRHRIDMTTFTTQDREDAERKPSDSYKTDFESAIEMIDWQSAMLHQQAKEIELLRQQVKHLESQVYGGTTK